MSRITRVSGVIGSSITCFSRRFRRPAWQMYVIGGWDTNQYSQVDTVYASVDGSTWTSETPLPGIRYGHTSVVLNSKLFVIGGLHFSDDYASVIGTTDGSTWVDETPLPEAIFGAASAVLGSKMYVIGGVQGSYDSDVFLDTVYSSKDGSVWATEPPLPAILYSHGAAASGQTLYVVGGGRERGYYHFGFSPEESDIVVNTVYSFDGTTWTNETALPAAVSAQTQTAIVGSKLFVLGAGTDQKGVYSFAFPTPTVRPTSAPTNVPSPLPSMYPTPMPTPKPAASPTPAPTMTTAAAQCIDCGRHLTGRALLFGYLSCC